MFFLLIIRLLIDRLTIYVRATKNVKKKIQIMNNINNIKRKKVNQYLFVVFEMTSSVFILFTFCIVTRMVHIFRIKINVFFFTRKAIILITE